MPTFDGDALTITLDTGVTAVDVKADLYGPWKEWVKVGTNMRFPLAFRPDGGAPLSAIINQGSYFFLNNAAGWRIRPPEENITVYLTGNLAVEDTDKPAFVPTVGTFTAAILGLQPVTQGVVPAMAEQLEYASFNGGVTIDTVDGAPGTAYPLGTTGSPVDNLADALSIAEALGFRKLFILGDLTVGAAESVASYEIIGEGATLSMTRTLVTLTAGCVTSNALWKECRITGRQGGESTYEHCIIDGLTNAHCHFVECGFIHPTAPATSTMQLASGVGSTHDAFYSECYGDYGTVTVDRNGAGVTETFDRWVGRLKFINNNRASGNGTIYVNMQGGTITIEASCTTGAFVITGECEVVNNSGGSTVDTDAVCSTAGVADAVAALGNWDAVGVVSIAPSPLAAIAAELAALPVETSATLIEAMRLMLSAMAGKVSGGAGPTVRFRNAVDDTKDRIVATVDADGNRTTVAVDVT